MNQILSVKNYKKKLKKFKVLFFISLIFVFVFSLYQFNIIYKNYKKEQISYNLLSSFNIEKLYSSVNQDYSLEEFYVENSSTPIGIIEIPKIDIKYPILPTINDDLLKISPCRFYGPLTNEVGNLCIAAHNYDDNRFFGNLNKLNIGDKINIYSANNLMISYYVYDIYETSKADISCSSQETNNKREITLVTCNNINKKRLIVKAKE